MTKNYLLVSTAVVFGAAWAGAAAAQSPAPAADTGAGQIETVVITAEKRSERLVDAPVSVSVVSTDQITKANATDISDLNNLVPSVQLNGTFNGRVPYGMRGVSSDSNEQTVGIASGVAIMIDGVPVPSDSYDANQLQDIQRVEVLKGPQATLGGRTASAGEINIVTRGPSETLTGSFSATGTDRAGWNVNGFLAGPITDKVQYSLSAYNDHSIFPVTNTHTGQRSYQDSYGVRGKLHVEVNSDFDFTLAGHYADSQSHGGNFVYIYTTPGATLLFPGSPLTQAVLLPGITPSWTNLKYNSSVPNAGAHNIDTDVSLEFNYQLGDLTFSSTTAYQYERQSMVQDLFALASIDTPAGWGPPPCDVAGPQYFFQYLTHCTAPYFGDTQMIHEGVRQISEEAKLVSPADRPFSWLIGFFYSDTTVDELYNRPFVGAWVDLRVKPDTATYDVYGRATWKFHPGWALVAGLRFNDDELSYTYDQTHYVYSGVDQGAAYSSGSNSSMAVVGDISLQHHFSRNSMAYLTYARGYAPKVYNTSQPLIPGDAVYDHLTPVAQTSINNFELGSKGTYLNNSLSLNASAFYTLYDNYQIQTYAQGGGTLPLLVLLNGGAETKGLELDTIYKPTNELTLSLNAAYIDATFTKYPNAPCYPTNDVTACSGTFDAKGKTLPNSPKFKLNLGAQDTVPLDWFDLTLNGSYSYRTSAQMLPDQNPRAIQGAFGILNLGVTARSKSGMYALTLFVNNVTDHRYYVDVEDFWGGPWGNNNTLIAQPAKDASRYVGVRLSVDF